jgi:DNA polymerase I
MKKIYLVDVSSMFFRAFYAVRSLTSPSGLPVNAIYGFLSMLIKLLKDEKPEYLLFCYDRKEPSFRKDMYNEYKANRSEMPEELGPQIPYIQKFAELLGISSASIAPYEADDIIGTVTKLAKSKGFEVIIVSGDKDFGQLIEDGVVLYDTMKEIRYNTQGVKDKWGIMPSQVVDYLAIVGDSSDNVPGVAGVGPKGAIKLLEEYGTLENIYENIEKVESKSIKQKLIDSKEMALLSKKLVTLAFDVPITSNLEEFKIKNKDVEGLHTLLRELNFKNFEKTLLGDDLTSASAPVRPTPVNEADQSINAPQVTQEVRPTLSSGDLKKYEMKMTVLTIEQLSGRFNEGAALWLLEAEGGVFLASESDTDSEVSLFKVEGSWEDLGRLGDTKTWTWLGHDLKKVWHKLNINSPHAKWDSMLAAYVLLPGEKLDFEHLVQKYLNTKLPDLPSAQDIFELHLNLHSKLMSEFATEESKTILFDIELPLLPILYRMEKTGIKIDIEQLRVQSAELSALLTTEEKKIHELAGEVFNIASPKQLGHILFEKLNLPVQKKTKTGFSTDTDVLEKLKEIHPIAERIVEYRELAKLKNTYLDALPQLADSHGRIHSTFNQAVTSTGRLSSTQPNLQNIPIRTERGARIRKAFVAQEGSILLSADYSQIELRILAHYSSDENLILAFKNDLDIHAATAAQIFSIPLDQVTSDLRRKAKAVNFGIAYGQGAFGLAENLGIGRKEASEIIEKYFQRFPGVKSYIEDTIRQAQQDGYVKTLFGRRRFIAELSSKNQALKKFGERAAINAPIQGTASDLVKKAMVDIDQLLCSHQSVKLILQVHDELIFEGPETALKDIKPKIIDLMEKVINLNVPLKVNASFGANWDEAH